MTEQFDFEGDEPAALISKRELSAVTRWPPKKIDSLVRSGMPNVPGDTSRAPIRFDLKAVFKWFIDYSAESADPMADIKKRKALVMLAREERRDREEAGEFYLKADVHREVDEAMADLRADLLSISASLVDQSPEVRAVVEAAIIAKINSMSFEFGGKDAPQS